MVLGDLLVSMGKGKKKATSKPAKQESTLFDREDDE